MLRSIKAQLGIVFLSFLLVVSASAAANVLAIRAQAGDATVINLAGRQRMLTQRMIWLALAQPDSRDLAAAISLFEQTQLALRDGGSAVGPGDRVVTVAPAPDADLRAQLDAVAESWGRFRARLQPADAEALQAEAPLLLDQLEGAVSAFEARAQAKVARLQTIQLVFVAAALLLLAWGYALTRRRIVDPLALLGASAQRIAAGHLADPVPVGGDDELGELGRVLDGMRTEVAAAHAHLETRVTQRTRELAAAFELSQEIVAQLNLRELLQSVADRTRRLARAQASSLCLLTPDGEHLELAAVNAETATPAELRQPLRHGLAARVVGAGETAITQTGCSGCGFLTAYVPGQCVAAPLRVGEHTLGALCAVRPAGQPFGDDESRALTLLANSAAVAIANSRLAETSRRQSEQAAILAERERLAAELHDDVAQTLGALNLMGDRARGILAAGDAVAAEGELTALQAALALAYRRVRAALIHLREPAQQAEPPPAAGAQALRRDLEACVAEFRALAGPTIDLTLADPAALALAPLAQAQARHIVREALTNARRHASAEHVWVSVERANGEARFVVADDGCGFDPDAPRSDKHFGLDIMRARAERSGGQLAIVSGIGAGTQISASFPLARESAGPATGS